MKLNQLRKLIREEIETALNEGKITDKMIGDYWDIMVKNQPDDVIDMLVKLTSGELSFQDFIDSTEEDIYDSFKDDEEFNEDDDDEDDDDDF
jgi:hypothetical protein